MKRNALILLTWLLVAGCGYKVVSRPSLSVYLAPVDNRTEQPMMGAILDEALRQRFIESGVTLVSTEGEADVSVRVRLDHQDTRAIQSGSDNRVTVSRDRIRLQAHLLGTDRDQQADRVFSLLRRFPVDSSTYVDDRQQEERELAHRMALQVWAWVSNRSTS